MKAAKRNGALEVNQVFIEGDASAYTEALRLMAEEAGINVDLDVDEITGMCLVELEAGDRERLHYLSEMISSERRAAAEARGEVNGVPAVVREEIKTWAVVNKSPYSNSFYNVDGITWGYKPEGSLRISDHWGWEDQWKEGVRHCELADEPGYVTGWRMAEYRNGQYHTVKIF